MPNTFSPPLILILLLLLLLLSFSPNPNPLASPTPISIYTSTSSPSPSPTPTPCQSTHDLTTANFQISDFLTFESSTFDNATNANILSFNLFDPSSEISTTCTRSLSGEDVASGAASLNDSSHYQVCDDDTRASFVWDGTRLTVLETWSCGGIVGELVGHLDFLLSCFDMPDTYVNGEGTLCELMAEEVVGRFTTIWDDTGFYVYGVGPDGSPL